MRTLLLVAAAIFTLTACGSQENSQAQEPNISVVAATIPEVPQEEEDTNGYLQLEGEPVNP